jgi:hypothetical protein
MRRTIVSLLAALALLGTVAAPVAWATDGTGGMCDYGQIDCTTGQLFDSQDPPHTTVYPHATKTDTGHSTNTVNVTDICATTAEAGGCPAAGTDSHIAKEWLPTSVVTQTYTYAIGPGGVFVTGSGTSTGTTTSVTNRQDFTISGTSTATGTAVAGDGIGFTKRTGTGTATGTVTATSVASTDTYTVSTTSTAVVTGSGTTGYMPKWTGSRALGDSPVYVLTSNVLGIGTTAPTASVATFVAPNATTAAAVDFRLDNAGTYTSGGGGTWANYFGAFEIANRDQTNGNVEYLSFSGAATSGGSSAVIGAVNVNHTTAEGRLVFWTHGASSYATRLELDETVAQFFVPILASNISATSTPYYIPKAGSDGKLALGWFPSLAGSYVPWPVATNYCGTCNCTGTTYGGASVTVACGNTACGSDGNVYLCNSPGGSSWTATGGTCSAPTTSCTPGSDPEPGSASSPGLLYSSNGSTTRYAQPAVTCGAGQVCSGVTETGTGTGTGSSTATGTYYPAKGPLTVAVNTGTGSNQVVTGADGRLTDNRHSSDTMYAGTTNVTFSTGTSTATATSAAVKDGIKVNVATTTSVATQTLSAPGGTKTWSTVLTITQTDIATTATGTAANVIPMTASGGKIPSKFVPFAAIDGSGVASTADNTSDLGSLVNRWRHLWLGGDASVGGTLTAGNISATPTASYIVQADANKSVRSWVVFGEWEDTPTAGYTASVSGWSDLVSDTFTHSGGSIDVDASVWFESPYESTQCGLRFIVGTTEYGIHHWVKLSGTGLTNPGGSLQAHALITGLAAGTQTLKVQIAALQNNCSVPSGAGRASIVVRVWRP